MIIAVRGLILVLLFLGSLRAADPTPEQVEFFEKRIRPVLVQSCYPCHSAAVAKPMAGLRVDTREGLLKAVESNTLLKAVQYADRVKMPPSAKLPDEQISDIRTWIGMGAPYPERKESGRHWAFQPVKDVQPPPIRSGSWARTPVDAFVLAKLEAKGAKPPAPLDRRTLLRRITFDLTGLPPAPEDLDAFEKDKSDDAYRHVVDRLLASPHYGERWARHWLDLVRYAETNGHEYDNEKLAPWRYRDYVIRAFNDDLPYDQFVREHIAGDLLPRKRRTADGATLESPVGTAFYWFGEVLNSATDSVKSRADEVDNQIDVLGKAFQGLTIACARCHDHKFDPIPTKDYYALAGILHSTGMREGSIDSPERDALIKSRRVETKLGSGDNAIITYRKGDAVFAGFNGGFEKWRASGVAFGDAPVGGAATSGAAGSNRFTGTLTSPKFKTGDKLYLHVRIAGSKADARLNERGLLRFTSVCDGYKGQHAAADGRPEFQWKTLRLTFERNRVCYLEIVDLDREGHISVDEIVYSEHKEPPPTVPGSVAAGPSADVDIPESAFTLMAADYEPHNVKVHIRGSHTNLGDEVPRGYLKALIYETKPISQGSGRLELADWIASPKNPLTARVMVNRVWKHHFGQGIVRSTDNFGATGDPPSDPELLDYLATQFVASGWSVKALHRMILLSNAYQSEAAPKRLEAETIRDAMLAVSGRLDRQIFGPSVPPHISKYQDGRGKPKSGPLDGNNRRSIYIQVRRNFLTPFFLAFDYPPPISSMGTRGVSTVPSQALIMMNNEFVIQQAKAWADRTASISDPKARLERMYLEAFGRRPEPAEVDQVLSFLESQSKLHGDASKAWPDVAHVLFNSAEFLYVR